MKKLLATTINQGTTSSKIELISELLARTSKPEKESETQDHDLSDDVEHNGHVVPFATQVGGVEKWPETCKKKEHKEERARRSHWIEFWTIGTSDLVTLPQGIHKSVRILSSDVWTVVMVLEPYFTGLKPASSRRFASTLRFNHVPVLGAQTFASKWA